MYKTMAARFNADNRLRFQHKLANYSIMILSVYVVILSASEKFTGNPLLPFADFSSLCLSVFVIGLASFEAGNDRLHYAFRLHENALKINALYQKNIVDSGKNIRDISEEYSKILAECEYNHAEIDRHLHIIKNAYIKNKGYSWVWFLYYCCFEYGFYILLIVVPPIISTVWLLSHFK